MGMFEQSILASENVAHKSRALAASFGMQAIAVAVAMLIPLLFTDRLPKTPLWTMLSPPLRAQPEPRPVKSAPSANSSPSILRVAPRVYEWRATAAHPAIASNAVILSDASLTAIGSGLENTLGVLGGLDTGMPAMVAVTAPKPRPAPAADAKPAAPRPVGGDVQAAKLIRKIVPVYPRMAVLAHVSGTVRLTGVIAKDGTVERLDVISGSPLLVPAAVEAVKQWLYRPTLLNGQPVEVIAPIDVIFTLSQ